MSQQYEFRLTHEEAAGLAIHLEILLLHLPKDLPIWGAEGGVRKNETTVDIVTQSAVAAIKSARSSSTPVVSLTPMEFLVVRKHVEGAIRELNSSQNDEREKFLCSILVKLFKIWSWQSQGLRPADKVKSAIIQVLPVRFAGKLLAHAQSRQRGPSGQAD